MTNNLKSPLIPLDPDKAHHFLTKPFVLLRPF